MKPRRPDSAKSHVTKITQDSEPSKKDLNASKFSETFSSGVNSIHEKSDQFKQYVAQKDKDPRFKHLKPKLQIIPEKNPQPQSLKSSFKPFQKKKDKAIDKNSSKKIEEKAQKIEKQQEQLSLSRGFAQKNKQKMNSLKLTASQQKQQEQKVKQAIRSKINFGAFKVNKPGEKKQTKKIVNEPKKQQSRNSISQKNVQKSKQQQEKQRIVRQRLLRQSQYRDIQRYVSDVQARNIMNFPRNYDQVVNNASTTNIADLQKIDLKDFMEEPTEGDYQSLRAKIDKMDEQIDNESIDLSLIGQSSQALQLRREQDEQNQLIYASMSHQDIKKKNAFITQILSGKISKKEIDQLKEMEKTSMRMYKIDHQKEEDDVQFTEINMVKKKTNRLIERNKIEASGQIYKDCDYLSEEHQKRIEQLLNGDFGESPYQINELEGMRRQRIDESIRMYREMSGSEEVDVQIFDDGTLPKDPNNRKKAEQKILKEKVSNVNQRLSEVDKIVVTKVKIQSLIKKFEHTRTSSNYQLLYQQNQQKFKDQMKVLEEAENMLKGLSNREDVDQIMNEIQLKYHQLEQQIRRFNQIDEKELVRIEKQRLRQKLRQVEKVEKLSEQCDSQIDQIDQLRKDIEQKLKAYDQIEEIHIAELNCEGYKETETLQDIDAVITKKWKLQHCNDENEQPQ